MVPFVREYYLGFGLCDSNAKSFRNLTVSHRVDTFSFLLRRSMNKLYSLFSAAGNHRLGCCFPRSVFVTSSAARRTMLSSSVAHLLRRLWSTPRKASKYC